VWIDTNGDVYVAEQTSPAKIEIFAAFTNYSLVQTITLPTFNPALRGILKNGSRLYVSDYNNNAVYELDQTSFYNFDPPFTVINGGYISNPTQLSMDASKNLTWLRRETVRWWNMTPRGAGRPVHV